MTGCGGKGDVKRPSYKLLVKAKSHVATGSPFDTTAFVPTEIRSGPSTEERVVDVSAFSYEKKLAKPSTQHFLKKSHGAGGLGPKDAHAKVAQRVASQPQPDKAGSGPKPLNAFTKRSNPPNTEFRRFYERADLPVNVDQNGSIPKITWKVPVDKLDYHHYLPLFFDGLRETEYPYSFLAEEGVKDMIAVGGRKILPCVPQLIIPIKTALATRDHAVMVRVIRVLQALVVADVGQEGGGMIGAALVPYYRQILPIFNIFKNKNTNIGDAIDYSQQKNDNLGDLINQTLELFERYGGEDAYVNIKYLVPTYISSMGGAF